MLEDNQRSTRRLDDVSPRLRTADMLNPSRAANDSDEGPRDNLELIDWAELDGEPVPEREWIVPGWILPRAVTLFAGAGGTGKSLLLQQWLTSIATGSPFMGLRPVAPVPTLYVNCEDDSLELHRRQFAICNAMGRTLGGLAGRVHTLPRLGLNNALGHFDAAGRFVPSDLLKEFADFARWHGIRAIGLDNVAHLCTGNEIIRNEVAAFTGALTWLALEIDGAVTPLR